MKGRFFVDSNIWVYLFSREDDQKREISERFIKRRGNDNTIVITYQVINEVTGVLKKKGFVERDIRNTIDSLCKICVIQELSKEMLMLASTLREKHSFSFWDSQIIAGAIKAQCSILATEDMQDGFMVDGLTICNIYSNDTLDKTI